MKQTVLERFWSKVDKGGPIGPYVTTPCWVWTAAKFRSGGYGAFRYEAGDVRRAHVMSLELSTGGQVPHGMVVRHACHNPACVNPNHLSVGTNQDNVNDCIAAGRKPATTPQRGEANRQSKLSDTDALAIFLSTEGGPTLARRYGVDHAVVYRIRSRKAWSHVTAPYARISNANS